ncbi:MAG TPA: acetylxylan esterase [Streptosporangiaceae bacterium]|nr:acetylxylan esterase [Streptosporangiaceae bacterium]
MSLPDLPLDELRSYQPDLPVPADMSEFWTQTLAAAAAHPVGAVFQPVRPGLRLIETFDVSFAGYGGNPVRGWLHVPAGWGERLPCVVQYVGYGGGRGLPHENLLWAAAGYAHFIMDTRGQGSAWSVGDTADPEPVGPSHPGFMTRGILDPASYYYRRLYVDCVRAVDAVREHAAVDGTRIAVTGNSQGGGLTLAVAGLRHDLAAVMPDVPFLCHFRRAVQVAERGPYLEVARYLKIHRDHVDAALRTLDYFDAAVIGRNASAPALFSVALQDDICPPSTVFAAYNGYGGPHQIREYAFNNHEGGEGFQQAAQMAWLAALLAG